MFCGWFPAMELSHGSKHFNYDILDHPLSHHVPRKNWKEPRWCSPELHIWWKDELIQHRTFISVQAKTNSVKCLLAQEVFPPDQWPSGPHVLFGDPTRMYPAGQCKFATVPNFDGPVFSVETFFISWRGWQMTAVNRTQTMSYQQDEVSNCRKRKDILRYFQSSNYLPNRGMSWSSVWRVIDVVRSELRGILRQCQIFEVNANTPK